MLADLSIGKRGQEALDRERETSAVERVA